MSALPAFWNATCSVPFASGVAAEELNGVPKKVGPLTSNTVPLQVPLVPVVPLGIVQVETYHFGLPFASYVYHAAKTILPRCVKLIPQPDSSDFHHKPLNPSGVFAESDEGKHVVS